jgi:hypothetical protein
MGKLIDISDILAVKREIAEYDTEERERFLEALQRLEPIIRDFRTVIQYLERGC